jgi:hypothetical protein
LAKTKELVEWKVSALSPVPSLVDSSPWKARNPKKMYWTLKGKKKNLQTTGLGTDAVENSPENYCVSHLSSISMESESF